MRVPCILLLLCFTFGTVSAFSFRIIPLPLPDWLTSLFQNTINQLTTKVCTYVAQNPSRATTVLQKINETLEETDQTQEIFTTTINYLNSPQNQLNLIGGQSTCPSFFSGLKDAISTDLKNEKNNSANTQQQAREILTKALKQLKALFN